MTMKKLSIIAKRIEVCESSDLDISEAQAMGVESITIYTDNNETITISGDLIIPILFKNEEGKT